MLYQKPRNDNARLAFLEKSAAQAAQDEASGRFYLNPVTITAVQSFIPNFRAAQLTRQMREAEKKLAVQNAAAAVAKLQLHMRDMWSNILRRVRREELAPAVMAYYELPAFGRFPRYNSRGEWLAAADRMVQGDAAAQAAGYPAISNPSATELQASLDTAVAALTQREQTQNSYNEAQQALAALRQQADSLIDDTADELRFALRKETASHRRAVMRLYGVQFSQAEEDTSDLPPEETPPGDSLPPETMAEETAVTSAGMSLLAANEFAAAELAPAGANGYH